jgi:hypothetical protein
VLGPIHAERTRNQPRAPHLDAMSVSRLTRLEARVGLLPERAQARSLRRRSVGPALARLSPGETPRGCRSRSHAVAAEDDGVAAPERVIHRAPLVGHGDRACARLHPRTTSR